LRDLPLVVRDEDWFACHGTPTSDTEYLLEKVIAEKTVLASGDEIAGRLGAVDASLILCGHSHIPRAVRLADGRTVVNPGSVGLPAYRDDQPTAHAVETGNPAARYAMVARRGDEWRVEFVCVPYDWRAAAAAARNAGWPAWARNLETGYG
jgi:diadenosine tetraphosphatase ApaH/serine/threonine PP2A family protein phosphatase